MISSLHAYAISNLYYGVYQMFNLPLKMLLKERHEHDVGEGKCRLWYRVLKYSWRHYRQDNRQNSLENLGRENYESWKHNMGRRKNMTALEKLKHFGFKSDFCNNS